MQIIVKFRVDLPVVFKVICHSAVWGEVWTGPCIPSLGRDGVGIGRAAVPACIQLLPCSLPELEPMLAASLQLWEEVGLLHSEGSCRKQSNLLPWQQHRHGRRSWPGQIWTAVLLQESLTKGGSWTQARLQSPKNEARGTRSGDVLPRSSESPDVWQTPSDKQSLLCWRKGRFLGVILAFLN